MVVNRFDGDKIAEEWTVSELAGTFLKIFIEQKTLKQKLLY